MSFFEILSINDLYNVVELPIKIHFGRTTIFFNKNAIFATVNLLRVNIFFLVVERLSIVPYWN